MNMAELVEAYLARQRSLGMRFNSASICSSILPGPG